MEVGAFRMIMACGKKLSLSLFVLVLMPGGGQQVKQVVGGMSAVFDEALRSPEATRSINVFQRRQRAAHNLLHCLDHSLEPRLICLSSVAEPCRGTVG